MVSGRTLANLLTLVNATTLLFRHQGKKISDPIAQQIRKYGYPVEVHDIYTDDGYRLRLHRIPHGSYANAQSSKKYKFRPKMLGEPLLLVHGAICSGSMWVVHPKNARKALAFQLADAGYDIWLFNARGTSPSLGHRNLTINDARYWNFSWHEIGLYDIPKSIDFILKRSGKNSLYYAGHSQGCSVFAVAMTTRPSYNAKVRRAILMTPGLFVHNAQGLVKTLIESRFGDGLRRLFNYLQVHWWPSKNPVVKNVFVDVCRDKSMIFFCTWALLEVIGPLSNFREKSDFMVFFIRDLADNISVRQLIHLQSLVQQKNFVMYDYGPQRNLKIYGQSTPRNYDLSLLTVPVVIMGAINDALVTQEDILRDANTLRNVQDVVMLPGNHLEFFYEPQGLSQLKQNTLKFFNNSTSVVETY